MFFILFFILYIYYNISLLYPHSVPHYIPTLFFSGGHLDVFFCKAAKSPTGEPSEYSLRSYLGNRSSEIPGCLRDIQTHSQGIMGKHIEETDGIWFDWPVISGYPWVSYLIRNAPWCWLSHYTSPETQTVDNQWIVDMILVFSQHVQFPNPWERHNPSGNVETPRDPAQKARPRPCRMMACTRSSASLAVSHQYGSKTKKPLIYGVKPMIYVLV